ncbi:MAG TPA: guanylate kinase [Patescibacteria group bacterium]|nr:guanylate kinase [Patescibacteria group bacterium]
MDRTLTELLDDYAVPTPGLELLKRAKIVFIVGISGAGKNTIIKELLKTDKYKLIISHTTRKPRKNHGVLEQDGKDYHFIDEQEAERMLTNGEFIEAKIYSGNIYGTSLKEVQDAYEESRIAISDIEVQGVSEYMKVAQNVTPIFLLPPDFNTWRERLTKRYEGIGQNLDDIKKRLHTAKAELQEALGKDYFEFVINDDLVKTVSTVDKIAHGRLSSEKNHQARQIAQDILQRL